MDSRNARCIVSRISLAAFLLVAMGMPVPGDVIHTLGRSEHSDMDEKPNGPSHQGGKLSPSSLRRAFLASVESPEHRHRGLFKGHRKFNRDHRPHDGEIDHPVTPSPIDYGGFRSDDLRPQYAAAPEPSSLVLLGSVSVLALGLLKRRLQA